ncbi:AAC(3) family N-acetyltransferase [Deinococcus sp.]|uniref:aminoglycoside N(3)-acetyltransferase n=1 Tax=Deinococcus sp. TaxID=47478 RepID=UPI0025E59F39|nr:AAC(3) family N-acetyltransferase [Deinococcus sp.]
MTEHSTIERTEQPGTRASLSADLTRLGLPRGATVLVHSSLSALGWVAGGPVAVVQALLDVIGPDGTLVMPSFSGDLSEPSIWQHPPVPEHWWPVIRAQTPAFDPLTTPTRMMGHVAETFRTWPGTRRSAHPQSSVAALGPQAEFITAQHPLADSMGEGSPFARLYDLNAWVLLLGTERNSSLHLAEHRSGLRGQVRQGAPVMVNGERIWAEFGDLEYDDDSFPAVKAAFEASGAVRVGQVGAGTARLMHQRELVDFAVAYWEAGAS